jgi:hypothetical protein
MPVTQNRPGPYAPSTAILEILRRNRDGKLPSPVTAEVLARAGILDSLVPRTLQALQTLDLINQVGAHTQILQNLQRAPEVEYQKLLAEWLRNAYHEVFTYIDPATADPTAVRDAFRFYDPPGQRDRMVTLFQGLCVAAALVPEKVAKPARPAPTTAAVQQRASASRVVRRMVESHRKPPANNSIGPAGVPMPLAGVLSRLPKEGDGWTKQKRDSFVTAFTAVLDFCFPIVEQEPDESETDEAA